jgi:hypothetical protein
VTNPNLCAKCVLDSDLGHSQRWLGLIVCRSSATAGKICGVPVRGGLRVRFVFFAAP